MTTTKTKPPRIRPARPARPAVGENIRTARLSAGMSQSALAEAADVGEWSLSRWEAGKQTPTLTVLFRLAKALKIQAETLISGIPGK